MLLSEIWLYTAVYGNHFPDLSKISHLNLIFVTSL